MQKNKYYEFFTSDGYYYCIEKNNQMLEYFTNFEADIDNGCLIINFENNGIHIYKTNMISVKLLNEEEFNIKIGPMINLKEHRTYQIKSKMLRRAY